LVNIDPGRRLPGIFNEFKVVEVLAAWLTAYCPSFPTWPTKLVKYPAKVAFKPAWAVNELSYCAKALDPLPGLFGELAAAI